jgi:hypothetical protein
MNSRRFILPALVLALALPAAAWASIPSGGVSRPTEAADSAGSSTTAGGAASDATQTGDSVRSGPGGGAPAPAASSPNGQFAPRAGAAQEPTPTTPQGGPQEPEPDQPTDDGGTQPGTTTGDGTTTAPSNETAPQSSGGNGGSSALGFLPHTGLELAAIAALGMALLLTGMALLRTARTRRPKTLR